MKIIRALLIGFALANLVGCVATIKLVVTNHTTETISVQFASRSAAIDQSAIETLVVPALDLPLQVISGETCTAFQLPLGTLPGNYYKPGIRSSVKISVIDGQEIRVEPTDDKDLDAISIFARTCEQDAEEPDS